MARRPRLEFKRVSVDQVERRWVDGMWDLYSRNYDGVDRAVFEEDLSAKPFVFIGFEKGTGRVMAFSTAEISTHSYRGEPVGIYFSGDTMVHPDYWGQRVLHGAIAGTLLRWRLRHPTLRLYWHLTCNGYRTFMTLVNVCPEYWPNGDRETPDWERGLIDSVSRERFGGKWRPDLGVVRDVVSLKADVAPFSPRVRAIPEVQYFLRANPGYAEGDELAVIGRMNARCFMRIAGKIASSAARRSPIRPVARRRAALTVGRAGTPEPR